MSRRVRILASVLTLSAAALVGIFQREGFTSNTIVPTKGDKPTNGFGSTVREDGSPVRMGEIVQPVQAARRALIHVQRDEAVIQGCLPLGLMLTQAEYDLWLDFSYNVGTANFCTSKASGGPSVIVRKLAANDYVGACNAILEYRFSNKFDCSTPGNKICRGVWTDRLEQQKRCLEAAP